MTEPTDYVYVPLPAELYAELVRRSARANVSGFIQDSVESFLDRTEGDPIIWSDEYIEHLAEKEDAQFRAIYGDPVRGFQWQALFLPNGTKIWMSYGNQESCAEIRHERLQFGDECMSPSQFASRVANSTSRNAWRDLYIKFPGDGSWNLADSLRRRHR